VVFVVLLLAVAVLGFDSLTPVTKGMSIYPLSQSQDKVSVNVRPNLAGQLNTNEFATVKRYSAKYGIDFRLMLALIQQESQFDQGAISEKGAQGLMQLMPVTNAEVSEMLDLDESPLPAANIRGGIYYFAKLLELFNDCSPDDRLRMALAAYNAGPSRIYDAQVLAAYLGGNPNDWSTIQSVLPLLSKRYYSLHGSIWLDGKPKSGYFGSWRQTVTYVDKIMNVYQSIQEKQS
jgi:membrane-bound lytic murein transglycosylase F